MQFNAACQRYSTSHHFPSMVPTPDSPDRRVTVWATHAFPFLQVRQLTAIIYKHLDVFAPKSILLSSHKAQLRVANAKTRSHKTKPN